mgnify:CR=1 FL=1
MIEELPADSEVDGHDAGSGQANIFIRTDNPIKAFEDVRIILKDNDAWSDVRIAYRDLERSEYTVLWPNNLRAFEVS